MLEGRRLFERETFGGNGRTCLTCHSRETGTVSPREARLRFRASPDDPLFLHDGSDDEDGDGFGDERHVTRMLESATVLMRIQLHPDVSVKDHPEIREVHGTAGHSDHAEHTGARPGADARRAPADAAGAGTRRDPGSRAGHSRHHRPRAQSPRELPADAPPSSARRPLQSSPSPGVRRSFRAAARRRNGGVVYFFEDLPPDFSVNPPNLKPGACAACHSGPMLNQTNEFLPVAVPKGTRFQTVLVSELNAARNPVTTFVFRNQAHDLDPSTNQDRTPDGIIEVTSPDPGRALITGRADDFFPFPPGILRSPERVQDFDALGREKVPHVPPRQFRENAGRRRRTLPAVLRGSSPIRMGRDPLGPALVLSNQDKLDIVAYLKLLH